MEEVIIQSHPNQTFEIVLNNQNCSIKLYQVDDRMFLDLALDNEWISYGNICLNRTSILQFIESKFQGVLFFFDTEGESDPNYEGVGNRFKLIYAKDISEISTGVLS